MGSKGKTISINLDVGDQLTSISCGHVVVELIKFFAYQRLQIPYTYQWLKQIVNKKKDQEEHSKKHSLQSERHFRTASTALDSLDFILKGLRQEISGPAMPEEICIALGATPVTCKELYRFILPSICHKPQCQSSKIAKDQKIQSFVLRKLVTSELLTQAFSDVIPPTNMHVFIRKKVMTHIDVLSNDNFVPASGSRIPSSCRVVVIDFRNNTDDMICCNDFPIYGDGNTKSDDISQSLSDMELSEIQTTDSVKWYQSTYVMKGFKDCVVNGNSVTNSWLD